MACEKGMTETRWYALRDLSRSNAKAPAYKQLAGMGFELFTPMTRRLVVVRGRRISREVPFMPDLLFVHASRETLDPVVLKTDHLQYRYLRGGYCQPMVVPDADMERFIRAVRASDLPRYFRSDELTPAMYGKPVRIVGGPLDGCEGHVLALRGTKHKRLLISIPNFLTVAVEVQPELIQLLE